MLKAGFVKQPIFEQKSLKKMNPAFRIISLILILNNPFAVISGFFSEIKIR